VTPFLTLDRLLLPSPLPALIALLLGLGIAALGDLLARALRASEAIERAATFVIAAGAVAGAVHGAAWAGALALGTIRAASWTLAAVGAIWGLARWRPAIRALREGTRGVAGFGRGQRAQAILVVAVLAMLLLAALGPATDADSLDYHLGVPLDWLRAGGAFPSADWGHARLVGIGESWNLLGLAAGTDAAGAVLQWAGLVACAVALASLADAPHDRLLVALFVVAAPVIVFLVPNQKPQMLGVAGTTVAIALVARDVQRLGMRAAALAAGSLAVAVGLKYAFLLTAWPAAVALLLAARRGGSARATLGVLALAFGVLVLPLMARNWTFYGDPLSPFLERFRSRPDPAVVAFADYLRSYAGDRSLAHLIRLPLEIAATWRPGGVTTVLGIGVLATPFAIRGAPPRARVLLLAAGGASVAIVLFGQLAGRFFLEPYLWAGAALALSNRERAKRGFVAALTGQAVLVAAFAAVGAVLLFPGALSERARERVMLRAASQYAELRWLDEALPASARVLTFVRSRALVPRPFVSSDAIGRPGDGWGTRALVEMVLEGTVQAVEAAEGADPRLDALEVACASRVIGPREFVTATRNPFNRGRPYAAKVLLLHPDARCRSGLERLLAEERASHGGG